ncbi:HAD family hydrolase [Actinacidiphila bryophytorum]|uniref:Phosphoglycolate phosphatase, HAD superfamily n=1 Tax=Actinacidiphila bryophytorum TaxID=1436133 RepID=A0A9W4H5C6_9ACTN|nr:haloacid dehalogenase-like hydrolase [Actinacidiphila bryophytorum]MBM9437338.1 haloacid dehalogenase-like hydrolase [Actinacidiphila bryophytorum]CAG7651688.1 Phosphoglycolate phosphatase, HAD superfamily [Actinacidiphila bryophytorum]
MALIVLWDIDHTLVDNGGVSKEIYADAYEAVVGVRAGEAAVTRGRTDRVVMREMFLRNGGGGAEWARVEEALAAAGAGRAVGLRKRGKALPGVRDVLMAASVRVGWVSSVLTGNIAANARMKLAAFGLDALVDLDVGAYGADAEDRPQLVDIARRRVHRERGLPADTPVVLVGDTPRDVEAALTSGAEVIAVASGVDSAAALRAAGAPVVLPDLADTGHVLRLLEAVERG